MNFHKRSFLALGMLAFSLAGAPVVSAETISISCGAVGAELQLCQEGADAWAKNTGHEVKVISTPNSATERLALYQQLLAAGAPDIDVFQIDIIWPGILSSHFIDLKQHSNGAEGDHFPAIIENNTINDQLVAMPWFTDAGLLYYRKDLLEKHGEQPPTTWEAMAATAKKIQDAERADGNDKMWGFVWQGKAYEGLTCNALEWVTSHNGGTVVDNNGKITVNNEAAIAAVDKAGSWVKGISPGAIIITIHAGAELSRMLYEEPDEIVKPLLAVERFAEKAF